jgi:hypothetical protein
MTWTAEIIRSGIALESLSDDLGTLGVPGTWYRVSDGTERGLLATRSRGDALRHFQRRVRLAQGPCPTCFGTDGHHVQCPKFLTD